MQLYNSQLATMLEIHRNIFLDENQQLIAVQIPIAEFEKIEKILEDYGLAKLIKESENEERVSKEIALNYYRYFKSKQS